MPIHYILEDHPLRPGERRAIPVQQSTNDLNDFLRFCTSTSTVSKADALAVVTLMGDWILKSIESGRQADFGRLGRTRLGLRAPTAKPGQQLNPGETTLTLAWQVSRELRKQANNVAQHVGFKREVRPAPGPIIRRVMELHTSQDNHYTPGGLIEIKGEYLKFDPQREDEGVFLKPLRGPAVRVEYCSRNARRTIHALVPANLSGPLRVSVASRGRTRSLRREGTFGDRLRPVRPSRDEGG